VPHPLADVAPPPDPVAYGVVFGACCFLLFVATAVVALVILIRRRKRGSQPID
jgi:hypothetical protein